jgi:hypothetical protein
MKYMNLIERYLFGQLSPEEEVLFEHQLSRDPALAQETARRFNAGKISPFSALKGAGDGQNVPAERYSDELAADKDFS